MGTRFLTATLFEGGRPESLTNVAAVIGPRREAMSAAETRFAELAGRAAWQTDFAYYGMGEAGAEPDYQIGYLAYEGAIFDRLNLDYVEFRMAGG